MTGKDLLEGLNFVDDDLIEEASEKKSKSGNRSGRVIFLRTAISAAAGLLIFVAGTAVGSRMAVKPLHSETTTYTLPEDGQNDENEHALAPAQEGMVGVQAENSDLNTLSLSEDVKVGRKIASSQTQQVQSGHLPQMPATVIGGISVYFYQEENAEDVFFADFEQNNVSYTLQANTLREVVQVAADTICGTGVITVVE